MRIRMIYLILSDYICICRCALFEYGGYIFLGFFVFLRIFFVFQSGAAFPAICCSLELKSVFCMHFGARISHLRTHLAFGFKCPLGFLAFGFLAFGFWLCSGFLLAFNFWLHFGSWLLVIGFWLFGVQLFWAMAFGFGFTLAVGFGLWLHLASGFWLSVAPYLLDKSRKDIIWLLAFWLHLAFGFGFTWLLAFGFSFTWLLAILF